MAPKDPKNPSSPLVPKKLSELKLYLPDLDSFEKSVEFSDVTLFDPPLDSSDVNPGHWIVIAQEIYKNYDRYDGFIILHGTDTMAFTASGLSFIFENISSPVLYGKQQ